jgi:Fur family peroxide stress response transcriptional regulator
MTLQRQTKYCQAIERILQTIGHATNAEILLALRGEYPDVSATTVHRASARLASRGVIGIAPPALDGSMRYDSRTKPHDHFHCSSCGILRDTDVKEKIIPILESGISGCKISGRLTISGVCSTCLEENI